MMEGSQIRGAFVSTNSVTQGEQVAALWGYMLQKGMRIHFAHRTFAWSSEARGRAAVHCVIIGFGPQDVSKKHLWDYDHPKAEPVSILAKNINPYLIDGPDIIVEGRLSPVSQVPSIVNGSIPADGGNLILSPDEKAEFVASEPAAAKWIKPYLGAEGFIHNEFRYCLWLVDCPPDQIKAMPQVMERIKAVRAMRLKSTKKMTQEKANTPMLFTENRQPLHGSYLAIPRTSSEARRYIPIGYLSSDVIAANDLQMVPAADLYTFGVVTSSMHNAWSSVTSGRLESRIRYSVKFTYNTFPWPDAVSVSQKKAIEEAAQWVLDARENYPNSTLADLYDANTMPADLVKAHQKLDKAVEAAYGKSSFKTNADRVAFLFSLYQKYTSLLPAASVKKARKKVAEQVI